MYTPKDVTKLSIIANSKLISIIAYSNSVEVDTGLIGEAMISNISAANAKIKTSKTEQMPQIKHNNGINRGYLRVCVSRNISVPLSS